MAIFRMLVPALTALTLLVTVADPAAAAASTVGGSGQTENLDIQIAGGGVQHDPSDPDGHGGEYVNLVVEAFPEFSGRATARVECVAIRGNRAVLGGRIVQSTGAFFAQGNLLFAEIEDNANPNGVGADRAQAQLSNADEDFDIGPICELLLATTPASALQPLRQGNFVVNDNSI
jgi:hypothetical protein